MTASSYDIVIRGARIVDGTGNPWFYGDVALAGDRIAAITPPGLIAEENVAETVEASGLVVSPGFIDIQSHSIVPLMQDPRCLSKITQGITTEIMGESWTPAPFGGRVHAPFHRSFSGNTFAEWEERAQGWSRFGDWLHAMVERGVTPNIGSFLGGGTLREFARGMDMGPASREELALMRQVMSGAMEDGAFGVSYALIYPPDAYTATDELVEVCKVVSDHGGIYITHIRSEGERLLEGVEEALQIGKRANVPVEIYHLKAAGRDNWQKMSAVLERINVARASGLDVTADMYPYIGAGTGLSSVLPPWVAEGNRFLDHLRDPHMRARIRDEVLSPSGEWEAMGKEAGPEGVMPVGFEKPGNQQYVGKRLSEIAEMRGQSWIDAAIDLLIDEEHRISTIYFVMTEENLGTQLRQPWMKISTDAGGVDPITAAERGPLHPRAYGTFPRVLRKYVREEGVLSLEDAVRKMSSAVADRLGIRDRGLLREGFFADVVIFDADTISDRATFENPHQLSVGIRDVWVNGTRIVHAGKHTATTPGRIVRGPGAAVQSSSD